MRELIYLLLVTAYLVPVVGIASDDRCVLADSEIKRGIALSDGSTEEEEIYLSAISNCPRRGLALYNLALVYSSRGETGPALQALSRALEIEKDPRYLVARGVIELKGGDLEAGRKSFEDLLDHDPKNSGALVGLAAIFNRGGERDRAIKLLEDSPGEGSDPIVAANLGVLYREAGRTTEAVAKFKEAARGGAKPELKLRIAEELGGMGEADSARGLLVGLRSDLPRSPRTRARLAAILASQGDFEAAATVISSIEGKLTPNEGVNWAKILITLGRNGDAISAIRPVIEADPNNLPALYVRAVLNLNGGDSVGAIEDLQRIVQVNQDDIEAYKLLALAYENEGRSEEANEALKLVAKLGAAPQY